MLQVNKILYSTDLSKGSEKSFEYAVFLAKSTGADIHILHVVEKLSSDAKMALESYVMDDGQRGEMLKARKRQALSKLEARQDEYWAAVDSDDLVFRDKVKSLKVIESYPVEAILNTSRDLGVDLIVMGTHEKGFVETFLGSVAKNVLSRSRVPVLVVPLIDKRR
ncbi:universal stress protein [Marinomonas sp. A79]|uniref:Universal stress protein n=1 Tax=Marinomonas vulgaris TaxID=2823372 RepID=A0ABS5HH41_9GAMM|nr:universal stress protein [Marinomonas vulgaris]MBR7890214.1 universal stress protein [Marinomonas vulgaris]